MGGGSSREETEKNDHEAQFKARVEQIIAEESRKQTETQVAQAARDERIKALMRDVLQEEKNKKIDGSTQDIADRSALITDLFRSLAVSRGGDPDKSKMINLLLDMQQQLGGSSSNPSSTDGINAYLATFIQKQLSELRSSGEVKITVEKKPLSTPSQSHAFNKMDTPCMEASGGPVSTSILSDFDPCLVKSQQNPQHQTNEQTQKSFQDGLRQQMYTVPPPPFNNKPMPEAADNNHFQPSFSRPPTAPPDSANDDKYFHHFSRPPQLFNEKRQFKDDTKDNNNKPFQPTFPRPTAPTLSDTNQFQGPIMENKPYHQNYQKRGRKVGDNVPFGEASHNKADQSIFGNQFPDSSQYPNGDGPNKNKIPPLIPGGPQHGTEHRSKDNQSTGNMSKNKTPFHTNKMEDDSGPFLDKGFRPHKAKFQNKEGAFPLHSEDSFRGPNPENFQNANNQQAKNQRGGFQHRGRGGPRGRGSNSYVPHEQYQNQEQREQGLNYGGEGPQYQNRGQRGHGFNNDGEGPQQQYHNQGHRGRGFNYGGEGPQYQNRGQRGNNDGEGPHQQYHNRGRGRGFNYGGEGPQQQQQHQGRGQRGRGFNYGGEEPQQQYHNQGQREHGFNYGEEGPQLQQQNLFQGQHDGTRFEDRGAHNQRGRMTRPRGGYNNQDPNSRSRLRPRYQHLNQSQDPMHPDGQETDARQDQMYQKGPFRGQGAFPKHRGRSGVYKPRKQLRGQEGVWNSETQLNAEDSDHESVISVESNMSTKTIPTGELIDLSSGPATASGAAKKKKKTPKKKKNKASGESNAPESQISKNVDLSSIKSFDDIGELSVKQLKEFLVRNRVDTEGFIEKTELIEEVNRLWLESPHARQELEKMSTDECRICMDAPIECALLECGHLATCMSCSEQLVECPICRQEVVRKVRIFKT